MTFRIGISQYYDYSEPKQWNGNETKSDILLWDIFKSDIILFLSKKNSSISMTFKIEISQFYD